AVLTLITNKSYVKLLNNPYVSIPPWPLLFSFILFFFKTTPTTKIYTLSLHDALPISRPSPGCCRHDLACCGRTSGAIRCFDAPRSEEHTSELQSQSNLVCRLLLEKKKLLSKSDAIQPLIGKQS